MIVCENPDGAVHLHTGNKKKTIFYLSLKHYWDKSRNNLKIDENERVHFNTL